MKENEINPILGTLYSRMNSGGLFLSFWIALKIKNKLIMPLHNSLLGQ